jgi:hypothetical protein
MATIDPRLIPLIEALARADADWLAFEILDGLHEGRALEETDEELRITRQVVRSQNWRAHRSDGPLLPPPPPEQILGDEQIDWAIDYISDRLSDVISMLDTTFDQLDAVLFDQSSVEGKPSTAGMKDGVILVLVSDEEERLVVRRDDTSRVSNVLPKLQSALRTWRDSTRGRGDA